MSVRPNATGIVAWNAIAPVMFPTASTSLPWRIQTTLLAFSGISVASGARISESDQRRDPSDSAIVSTRADEQLGAEDDGAERDDELGDHLPRVRRVVLLVSKYSGSSSSSVGVAALA